ncbi:hypothetical protein [Chlorogloeopsis sp. ULAP02]|uniref:hypothetical protein n=1 Tax=Chlorogloeopsis sp. ULAP02 TaxID=3107926 RepID=UPI0031354CEA
MLLLNKKHQHIQRYLLEPLNFKSMLWALLTLLTSEGLVLRHVAIVTYKVI